MRRSPRSFFLLCASVCAAAVGLAVISLPSVARDPTDSQPSEQDIVDAIDAVNSSVSDAVAEIPSGGKGESQMAKDIAMQRMMYAKSLEKANAKAKKAKTAAITLGALLGLSLLGGVSGLVKMGLRYRAAQSGDFD